MTESKSFASLSPTLLARKGAARPAMRSQLQPMQSFQEATARELEEDLGFNDLGEDNVAVLHHGEVVSLIPATGDVPLVRPEVHRQQEQIATRVNGKSASLAKARRSALAEGRSAAFTLRLDAERHLQLRLASTLRNRSAQQLVTEALDHMLANMPDVAELAVSTGKCR